MVNTVEGQTPFLVVCLSLSFVCLFVCLFFFLCGCLIRSLAYFKYANKK